MRTALLVLLLVHGLIHLLGFVKAFDLAKLTAFSGRTLLTLPAGADRVVGLLWLLVCLGFLGTAVCVALGRPSFVWLGTASVVLSQLLVLYAWPDAKAGTFPNVVIALWLVIAFSDARFQQDTDSAAQALLASTTDKPARVVHEGELAALPEPVGRWLRASGVVGKPYPKTVRLKQRGLLRTAADQAYMPAEAEQYFTLDPPGFVWRVRVNMMRVLPVAGRDSYVQGRGRMQIRALSLIPIVDAADDKIDQGSLLRFLGEMVWFPAFALSPRVTWESVDESRARATLSHLGVQGSAVFSVDDQDRFASMTATRYLGAGPDAKLERWVIPATEWRRLDGVVVPVKGDVIWALEAGDFSYYRWEITELQYDQPELY